MTRPFAGILTILVCGSLGLVGCTKTATTATMERTEAGTAVDATPAAESEEVSPSAMRALGRRAAKGDLKAVDELEAQHERLYRDIDYHAEPERVRRNRVLMSAAFDEIGKAAGADKAAMEALRYAHRKERLRSFTPDAFGIAAGLGNAEALDVLLHYRRHGILLASAVFALQHAAEKNNPAAVKFLMGVLEDEMAQGLWPMASGGLVAAAEAGNEEAAAALERYDEREEQLKLLRCR